MCFEDVCGVADGDWDDRAFCFGGDFEASFMEWKHVCLVCISVSGSFREDADGNAGFYFFYCCEDGFQTLFDVFSVKEEAVKVAHPGGQQRDFFHFFFGNVACADRAAGVGEKDVEVASVVADVQDWGVFWNVFFSDHGDFGSCDPQDEAEDCLNDPEGADVFGFRGKFADDPFYEKYRD